MAKDCKKEGLKSEKRDISKAVSDVMTFFHKAKSTDGKKSATRKSTNLAEKQRTKKFLVSRGGVYSKFWSSIGKFDGSRSNMSCLIASCNFEVRQCVKSLDQPFLLISSIDLNERDFGKELGRVLLEEQSTVCVETEGLTREGSARIVSFLKLGKDLFDSRVRFILFGEAGVNADIDDFSEKHFLLEDLSEFEEKGTIKCKLDKVKQVNRGESYECDVLKKEASELRKEVAATKEKLSQLEEKFVKSVDYLKVTDEKLEATKSELNVFGEQLENTEKERDNLKSENLVLKSDLAGVQENCDQKCSAIEKNSTEVLAELSEVKKQSKLKLEKDQETISQLKVDRLKETGFLQNRITELELQVSKLKESQSKSKNENLREQQTQTNKVVISPTPLATVKDNLKKNGDFNPVEKVYRSVKELKCNMNFGESSSGWKCVVDIVRGKNISSYPSLCHFNGVGETKQDAKFAAFSTFVSSVVHYQE